MISPLRLGIAGFIALLMIFTGLAQASAVRNEDKVGNPEVTAHVIEIRSFVFSPLSLEVKTGDTITWTNFDIVPHTTTAMDSSWDSGSLKFGESFTFKVTDNMQLDYFCIFHPMMKASLTFEK
jgi:plastocyanin